MKKLLIGIFVLILLVLDGCGLKSQIQIHNKEAMYVSSTEYEKLSCKELDYELYNYGAYSCKELKDNLLYISPIEYKKLSCKQLHEQIIKIDKRLNAKLEIKSYEEKDKAASMVLGAPLFFLTTAGVPLIAPKTDAAKKQDRANKEADKRKVAKFDSEVRRLKEEYKTLKEVAVKKNCSFVKDIEYKFSHL